MEIIRQEPERAERRALFGTHPSMQMRPHTVAEQGLPPTVPPADPTCPEALAASSKVIAERIRLPADVRKLSKLIADSQFCKISKRGHLAPTKWPSEVTMHLSDLLAS